VKAGNRNLFTPTGVLMIEPEKFKEEK